MNGFLKKLKITHLLMFTAAFLFAFFAVFTALSAPDISCRSLNNTVQNTQNFPANPLEEPSDVLYVLQRTYGINSVCRLLSQRRNFTPVPPTYGTQDLSSLPLVKQISKSVSYYTCEGGRSYFQQYLKHALPLRAGPFDI